MNNLYFLILFIIGYMALAAPTIAQNANKEDSIPKTSIQKEKAVESIAWSHPLTVTELVLVCFVFIVLPIHLRCGHRAIYLDVMLTPRVIAI